MTKNGKKKEKWKKPEDSKGVSAMNRSGITRQEGRHRDIVGTIIEAWGTTDLKNKLLLVQSWCH